MSIFAKPHEYDATPAIEKYGNIDALWEIIRPKQSSSYPKTIYRIVIRFDRKSAIYILKAHFKKDMSYEEGLEILSSMGIPLRPIIG